RELLDDRRAHVRQDALRELARVGIPGADARGEAHLQVLHRRAQPTHRVRPRRRFDPEQRGEPLPLPSEQLLLPPHLAPHAPRPPLRSPPPPAPPRPAARPPPPPSGGPRRRPSGVAPSSPRKPGTAPRSSSAVGRSCMLRTPRPAVRRGGGSYALHQVEQLQLG